MPSELHSSLRHGWKLAGAEWRRFHIAPAVVFLGSVFSACQGDLDGATPPLQGSMSAPGVDGAATSAGPSSPALPGASVESPGGGPDVNGSVAAPSSAGPVPGSDLPGPATPDGTSEPVTEPSVPSVANACESVPVPPRAPLRRLTRYEYNNTVRDLLGVTNRPADALPGEEAGSGFGNDADALGVSRVLIDGYRIVAQQIAQQVTSDAAAVQELTGCDPALADTACAAQFLTSHLTAAFRRPPDAQELASYQATFERGVTLGGDFTSGARAVVERSLQAPQFLYRIELAEPLDEAAGLARPTGYEMATRLSYLLWSSKPDQELIDAAGRGDLDSEEGVRSQALRMLEDDHAKDSLRYFHGQLFGIAGLDYIERDREYYPTFVPGMGALFRQETEQFLDHVLFEGEGDLSAVFTAPYTFVNQTLAEFYGIPDVTGEGFQQVPVDPARRAGLLTQASILTATTPGSRTDPVVRGKWLYTKLLCGKVPDPPPDVPLLEEPDPGQSVRERLERHRSDPGCATCHAVMDPIGLAFEHYDGVGLWRDTDNGAPIDDSGEIPIGDVAGPFQGAIEFGQRMAESRDVRACYVGRYLTYAYGRAITKNDDCSLAQAAEAFELSAGNVKELMLAVTATDGFRLRPLTTPDE